MRRILYASDRKIDTFLSGRSQGTRGRGWSFGGGVAGISLTAAHTPVPGDGSADPAILDKRLIEIQRHLLSTQDLPDFQQHDLRLGEWITFDCDMAYGTAHEDSGRMSDDVTFFASKQQPQWDTRITALLLCGSIEHMRDRTASAGRMGSSTEWLHELTRSIYDHEVSHDDRPIEELTELSRPPWPHEVSEGQVARWVHDVLNMSPTSQHGRLRGYAEVLLDDDDEKKFIDRLVLATPLYVELVPPEPRVARWKRWRRRLLTSVGRRSAEFH